MPMSNWTDDYNEKGYAFPFRSFDHEQAKHYRHLLEKIELDFTPDMAKLAIGHANALIPFVDQITRLESVLNPVKQILGPDILVWNSSFFIKEPHTTDFISWHQDLTYWGLTDSHEVTAWIAFSEASVTSGCMKFIPGSHTGSIVEHRDTFASNNLLSRGQEIAVEVNEAEAVNVLLKPGEMSLHHGQVFHGSYQNQSDDRRIGLAIRYITPDMKQTIDEKTDATLVSGVDEFNHFNLKDKPNGLLNPDDIAAVKRNIAIKEKFLLAGVSADQKLM